MKKRKFKENSLLAKWLKLNYDSLPASTCGLFWSILISLITSPFLLITLIFLKTKPKGISDPKEISFGNTPLIAYTAPVSLTFAWIYLISDILHNALDLFWLPFISLTFLAWFFFIAIQAIQTAKAYNRRLERERDFTEIEAEDEEEKIGSIRILWESIVSAIKKTCVPIEWV